MCGISGIYSYNSTSIVDKVELKKITNYMENRGPDSRGLWINKNNKIGFGHRRLSIIDTSDKGSQPMYDSQSGNYIVFNGEIYNYLEIRRGLEKNGCIFQTNSDTEVLLKLYNQKKEKMLTMVRGMFAFSIWDEQSQSLFLARDTIGIKPLYYSNTGKVFRFASQVKALIFGGNIKQTPNPAGHAGFFTWGYVPEPHTMYKEIKALPAGHWMRINSGSGAGAPILFDSVSDRIVNSNLPLYISSKSDAIEYASDLIKESIEAHLVSDVPVGVFLSSGMDSSMLASNAVYKNKDVKTITLGFKEYKNTKDDEVPLAEELAGILGTNQKTIYISEKDFQINKANLLHSMDQPSIDGVNSWFVARAARLSGLKVALSGIGGDEILGSYPSFIDVPKIYNKFGKISKFRNFGRIVRSISSPILKSFTSPKYAGLIEYGGSLEDAYLLRRSLFMPWELSSVMDPDMVREGWKEIYSDLIIGNSTRDVTNDRLSITSLEASMYMKNQLLRDADWAGMSHSVEIRTPFADIELISKVSSVFTAYPDINKQQVSKVVSKILPKKVLNRDKSCFSTPVRKWMQHEMGNQKRGLRSWASYIYKQF